MWEETTGDSRRRPELCLNFHGKQKKLSKGIKQARLFLHLLLVNPGVLPSHPETIYETNVIGYYPLEE